MKFIHIADIHLDRPFINLSDKENLGDLKRIEQRKVFKEVIQYVKNNNIDCLFIAGDLYEQQYIKQSTIEYINNLFREIENTKVFISPGNHDPFVKNSYYSKFKWNDNVHIFTGKIEKVELEDTDIYGYGFDDFYCSGSGIEKVEIDNKNKNNILVMHGTLDGADLKDKQYNSINYKTLQDKEFDYIALGHIHKNNFKENERIVYPGSLTSLGFDELGNHGMVVGNIENKKVDIKFVPIESSKFIEKEIDVTDLYSKEDLIQKIDEMEINENEFVKVNLIGKRNFEIDLYSLYPLILNMRIIKIKDETKTNFDLEKLSRETTLKGLFIKEMKEKLEKAETNEEKEMIEKAIEIGLDALN